MMTIAEAQKHIEETIEEYAYNGVRCHDDLPDNAKDGLIAAMIVTGDVDMDDVISTVSVRNILHSVFAVDSYLKIEQRLRFAEKIEAAAALVGGKVIDDKFYYHSSNVRGATNEAH